LSRKNYKKSESLLLAVNYLNSYALVRQNQNKYNNENRIEVNYNTGRFFQFIGHNKIALEFYDNMIVDIMKTKSYISSNSISVCNNDKSSSDQSIKSGMNLKMALYNKALYYKSIESNELAHEILINNIVI